MIDTLQVNSPASANLGYAPAPDTAIMLIPAGLILLGLSWLLGALFIEEPAPAGAGKGKEG